MFGGDIADSVNDESGTFVSVIIPVLNDPERLQTCLGALEDQTYPKSLYEVVVVDNGSDQDIRSLVAGFGQAQSAREERPSSYAARNKGLSLARGKVIAFTDADCVPVSDWVEKGVARLLSTPGCGLVAGKVSLFFKDPNRPTATELFESLKAFPQKQWVEKLGFGATANVFTFKSVVEDVGLFDDRLRSLGDWEWGQRVGSSGYGVVYADEVCVRHPARHSLGQLHNMSVRKSGGFHELARRGMSRRGGRGYFLGFEKEFFPSLVPPLRSTARILSNKELGGIVNRIKVALVNVFERYLYVWERVRLRLGAKPRGV